SNGIVRAITRGPLPRWARRHAGTGTRSGPGLDLDGLEGPHRGTVEHPAVDAEAGAVAGAVPAALGGVELHPAAQVGAGRAHRADDPARVTVRGDRAVLARVHDPPVVGGQVGHGRGAQAGEVPPHQVAGHVEVV